MLLLLVSLALFSAAWGQTSNCPNIRFIQASQQTLINTTAQIRDMLSSHIQQQSTSESLTNLMQLTLARQLAADLDMKPPTSPTNTCDGNKTANALKQLKAQSLDNDEAIRNLITDIKRLQSLSVDNDEAIHNLTIKNKKLQALLLDKNNAIYNLTINNERMEAEVMRNKEAIFNLTTDNKRLMAQSAEYRETLRNLTINNDILEIQFAESIKVIHNLTADNKLLKIESAQSKEAISNLTINNERVKALSMDNSATLRNLTAMVETLLVCGSSAWTRVAYLNMTNPSEQCPSGFKLYNQNGVRACGRPDGNGCLSSVQFPVGMTYSEVCGRVTGYQYWGPDAFSSHRSINDAYVEGVSLTHGSPRKHIWSFAAGYRRSPSSSGNCPCSTSSGRSPPSFVGNNYYCETGYTGQGTPPQELFSEPLWDGKGCSSEEAQCCQAAGIPWFHKRLSTTTNDYIELRVCASNPSSNNEDIPVGYYEIYVK